MLFPGSSDTSELNWIRQHPAGVWRRTDWLLSGWEKSSHLLRSQKSFVLIVVVWRQRENYVFIIQRCQNQSPLKVWWKTRYSYDIKVSPHKKLFIKGENHDLQWRNLADTWPSDQLILPSMGLNGVICLLWLKGTTLIFCYSWCKCILRISL